MLTSRRNSVAPFLAILTVLAFEGCQQNCNVKLNDNQIAAKGVQIFWTQGGQVDTVNTCSPVSSPAPNPDLSTSKSDEVVVGFDHWRNTTDSCQESKVLIYRGYVLFDVTSLSGKSNLINRARVDFDAISMTPSSSVCAASLGFVTGTWSPGPPVRLPPGIGSNPPTPFPGMGASSQAPVSLPGTLPTSNVTSGTVQVTTSGHFSVDVTSYVMSWVQNTASNRGVAFTSSDETFPLPVPGSSACRTHYANFVLHVFTV